MLARFLTGLGAASVVLVVALGVWGWGGLDEVQAARRTAADRRLLQLQCDRTVYPASMLARLLDRRGADLPKDAGERDSILGGVAAALRTSVRAVIPERLATDVDLLAAAVDPTISRNPGDLRRTPGGVTSARRLVAWFRSRCKGYSTGSGSAPVILGPADGPPDSVTAPGEPDSPTTGP
ncbi:MAG: hypothetical protein HYX34_15765 [Actinobacteria bacterium]|nr:hypothetical protein [Actinomycetota bacterium]